MVFLYSLLVHLGFILVFPYLVLRALVSPAYKEVFLHRMGRIPQTPSTQRIWIHCASVGEVMALGPLLRKIEERLPLNDVALSVMTRTGMDIAMRTYTGIGRFFFLPCDFSWTMGRALRIVNPKVIVILETELWPNLLATAKKGGIPVLLINGRISEGSFRGYMRGKKLFKRVLEGIVTAAMQSHEDLERIVAMGVRPERVCVTGNLKFDSLVLSHHRPSVDGTLGNNLRKSELFIAGSTHRGEEEIILNAFAGIHGSRPAARLLLAPRHLERIDEVASLVLRSGFRYIKRTELDNIRIDSESGTSLPEVILLDTMGELAGFYSYGRAIFVGGSLIPQGGHNVLEPALNGKAVFFGPHMESFKEARDLLLSSGGGVLVRNSDDIRREVLRAFADPEEHDKKGKRAREAISLRRGAAQRNFSLLEPYL